MVSTVFMVFQSRPLRYNNRRAHVRLGIILYITGVKGGCCDCNWSGKIEVSGDRLGIHDGKSLNIFSKHKNGMLWFMPFWKDHFRDDIEDGLKGRILQIEASLLHSKCNFIYRSSACIEQTLNPSPVASGPHLSYVRWSPKSTNVLVPSPSIFQWQKEVLLRAIVQNLSLINSDWSHTTHSINIFKISKQWFQIIQMYKFPVIYLPFPDQKC